MDDLTDFLKGGSGGPVDHGWLDVDEEEYRRLDTLPKQNLDITPDLKGLWSHQDRPGTSFIPNTGAPRAMGDLTSYGPMRTAPEDIIRTARLAMMQSSQPGQIKQALDSRYDLTTLRANRTTLASVLVERGLLGPHYIDASDFPNCNQGGKKASDFARKYAPKAAFLKAKAACADCTNCKTLAAGSNHCSVFHKQIVVEVPYSDDLAEAVELGQKYASSGATPKGRIRAAHLAEASQRGHQPTAFSGHQQVAPKKVAVDVESGLVALSTRAEKTAREQAQKLAMIKARPIVNILRREMLKGRSRAELNQALKLAFDPRDLAETRDEWAPLYKEAGLYGVVYTTQESFDDCRIGADFLSKHGSKTRAIVAGDKCSSCIFSKIGRCMMYGKRLVASASEVITAETAAAVLDEQKLVGNLPHDSTMAQWGKTAHEALRRMHDAAGACHSPAQSLRTSIETAFYGQGDNRNASANELVKRDVLQKTAQYLNEGLYGADLQTVLRGRFLDDDLRAASVDLRPVLAEQGLQGITYIDPNAYDDYGHGCKTAAAKHRSRAAVRYAKIGSKCATCVHHTRPGHCSVLNKQLVVEPPYIDKLAEQQAILNSGPATKVSYESLMNNGLSMMDEYQLQHGDGNLTLNREAAVVDLAIEFGAQDFKL